MPQQEYALDSPGAAISQEPQSADGPAIVGGRYEVTFSERLNHLDSPQAHAFGVRDLEGGSRHRFALVLTRNSYGRFTRIAEISTLDAGGMLRIFSHGPLAVPDAERQRMALILERPAGGRVMMRDSKPTDRIDERAIIDRILVPMEDSLRAFHRAGLTHRAVRPDNIFFRDRADGPAGLGECLTAPPGFDQPDAFEPIESAMASPAGRGDGTAASDMFALGVTIVTLLKGRWSANMHQPQRLLRRMERGSYRELAGRLNCSHDMGELLAGLLYDNPERRWNVDQLRAWLNHKSIGRRPFQHIKSAVRPFKIEGMSCSTPRAAAFALSRHVTAARGYLAYGHLTRWLERSLGNIHLADAVAGMVGDGSEDDTARPTIDDKTVARVCRVLDPDGPVYFDDAAIMLDGFGYALAEAIMTEDGGTEKKLESMLASALPIERLPEAYSRARRQQIERQFRGYQGFARGAAMGTGIERCLYEMNPGIPCQSALLGGHTVRALDALLPALNHVAAGGEAPSERPRDAHITAFLATHMPVPEQQRAANDVARAAPGSQDSTHDLAYFARVQQLCGHGRLRNLARWLGANLAPAIEGYYSRSRRLRLAAQLSTVMGSGKLDELLTLVNDRREQVIDREEYAHAVASHNHHARMTAHFRALFAASRNLAQSRGRRAAYVFGCIVLLISCVAAVGGGPL
jgi:hypothetical protein